MRPPGCTWCATAPPCSTGRTGTAAGELVIAGGYDAPASLAAGETRHFYYGSWTTANAVYSKRLGEADWWCMEQGQTTRPNEDYAFNGALLPAPLAQLIQQNQDNNANGTEDHVDWVGPFGVQTNYSIWEYQALNPVIAVGRDCNYLELAPAERARINVQVTNLGAVEGSALVTETVPAGFAATDFSQAPVAVTDNDDGSISYPFEISAIAGATAASDNDGTAYSSISIGYTLIQNGLACDGRTDGHAATALWTDGNGIQSESRSAALILDCCAGNIVAPRSNTEVSGTQCESKE